MNEKQIEAKIKEVRKHIREILPGSNTKVSKDMPRFLVTWIFLGVTAEEAGRRIGQKRQNMSSFIYSNEPLKKYVEELKQEIRDGQNEVLSGLINKALTAVEDSLDKSVHASVRLKAAELVLKRYDILTDSQKVEVSGKIDLPIINIVSTVKED